MDIFFIFWHRSSCDGIGVLHWCTVCIGVLYWCTVLVYCIGVLYWCTAWCIGVLYGVLYWCTVCIGVLYGVLY